MKELIVSGASPYLMPREDPAGKLVFMLLFGALVLLCFLALVTILAAVLRGQTDRARRAVQDRPFRTMLMGVAGWLAFGAVAAWFSANAYTERLLETEVRPGFLVAATVAAGIPLVLSLLGAAGLFAYVGDRVAALRRAESSQLRRLVTGCFVAVFAAFFPFVGWFVVLPMLLATAFGAGSRSLLR